MPMTYAAVPTRDYDQQVGRLDAARPGTFDLSPDLWRRVGKHLHSVGDFVRLMAVARPVRAALQEPHAVGARLQQMGMSAERVTALPEGQRLRELGRLGLIQHNLDRGRYVARTLSEHEKSVHVAAFSRDGEHLVTASLDCTVRTWSLAHAELPSRITLDGRINSPWTPVQLSQNGERVLTVATDGAASVRTLARPEPPPQRLRAAWWDFLSSAFSHDNKRVLTTFCNSTADVFSLAEPNLPPQTLRGHGMPILSAAFSYDDALVVTTSADATARVWTLAQPERPPWVLHGHAGYVTSAAFNHQGDRVATAGERGAVHVWSVAQPERPLFTLRGHTNWVHACVFSRDDRRLLTASRDQTARLWSLTHPERPPHVLTGHPWSKQGVLCAAFSPDDARIATTGADGTIRVLDFSVPFSA